MQFHNVRIGINPFLWFISILAVLAIIVLCVGSFSSMRLVGQKALEVRQIKLPELEETQRSMINLEGLRRLAEVVYTSNDPFTRRKSRIKAQSLATESVFTRNNDFYTQSKNLVIQINSLASTRDKERLFQNRMDTLQKNFMSSMFRVSFIIDDEKSFADLIEAALPIVYLNNKVHNTEREAIATNLRQLPEDLANFKKIELKCREKSLKKPALLTECEKQKSFHDEYAEIIKGIHNNTSEAYKSWQDVDEALRELRDIVRTDAEFETYDALTSIEQTSKKAIQTSLWLGGVGISFFILYLGILHYVLVRPVRWAGLKLLEIQQGVLDTPVPKIYIRELYQVGDLLDRFSAHIADLTSQASQLAEDAAEKRDLEELMKAVFQLSVDGYIVWGSNKKLSINSELLHLLGFNSIEEIEFNWDEIGFTPLDKLPELFDEIQSKGFVRDEFILTTAYGELIPFEVSFIPLKRQSGMSAIAYFRDLRQQKITEEALRTAKNRAEDAAQVKSEFLARMSHEIRTPMNGVLGMTGIALRENPPPAQRLYLERIQASASILLKVINDILDFSKIESGNFILENCSFPFARMLNTITDLFSFQAEEKKLSFLVEADPEIPEYLMGDELRLAQVILNLCGNAMKFTDQGGVTVRVTLENEDESHLQLRFSVIDTGIGLTQQEIKNLFKPFSQADSSTTRKYGGTGLGLVISDMLVKRMNGHLVVSSIPGEGSIFSFNIRLGKETSPIGSTCLHKKEKSLPSNTLNGMRILLAEDNEINQEVAIAMLENFGATVILASNGQEALDLLKNTEVDCILMDIQMPIMDGLSATKAIRLDKRKEIRNLPIIAMTAHAMEEDREKSIKAGMNLHITKPIDYDILRNALLELTQKSESSISTEDQ